MNQINLIGRITRDLELKTSKGGKSYSRFTIAVNRDKETADFIDCVAFGKTAELITEYFQKGSMLGVTGSLQTSTYEKDGVKFKNCEVFINNITFIPNGEKKQNNTYSKPKPKQEPAKTIEDDDEFPF